MPKAGLRALEARAQVGELYLADIGVPPSLYEEPALSLRVGALFAEREILRLDPSHNQPREQFLRPHQDGFALEQAARGIESLGE